MTDNTMRRWSTRLLQPPRRMIDRNRVSRLLHQPRDATTGDRLNMKGSELSFSPRVGSKRFGRSTQMVGRPGLEPGTLGLKVPCSA